MMATLRRIALATDKFVDSISDIVSPFLGLMILILALALIIGLLMLGVQSLWQALCGAAK